MKRIIATLVILATAAVSAAAAIVSPVVTPAKGEKAFTIHLMGDSTMAPKDLSKGNPERGWGMMFPNFLDGKVEVMNYAQNGRSTKSFIDLGLWDKVRENLKAGDYVFIEFGHNDAKEDDPQRYAPAFGAYLENLRTFVRTAQAAGAHPVLLTPVSRRWFKGGKLDLNCHTDYPAAMRQVAEETGAPLLDILKLTQDWISGLGDEASAEFFMHIAPGTCPACPDGKEDNTHTKANGARKVASLVCQAISGCEALGELAGHLATPADIVVAQDGTGDYFTVQEAINACPDYEHAHITTIHIKAGTYKEMVTIPHNKFRLHIKGDGAENTIITYDKYATRHWPGTDRVMGTSGSASVYVHSSYVTFEDLTIENTAGEGKEIAQAVALFTDGDFLFFHNCRLIANQDTVYTYGRYGKEGGIKRNYYLDCYIEGTTDFIFGPSIAYFEGCTIHSKKNSYVTAASTFEGQKYGYVFHNCRLTADEGIDKCYLGRPWGAYAKTVFIECELGSHILPEGWHNWEKEGKPNTEKNSYYAEYRNYGPGAADRKQRVKWSYQLTPKQAAEYTFEKVMYQPQDGIVWNPFDNK
ncbi:MAG: pectin esterase [Bacteroidales bacterium]|nr:pectin esterase [Bacteroidales bacterium]